MFKSKHHYIILCMYAICIIPSIHISGISELFRKRVSMFTHRKPVSMYSSSLFFTFINYISMSRHTVIFHPQKGINRESGNDEEQNLYEHMTNLTASVIAYNIHCLLHTVGSKIQTNN